MKQRALRRVRTLNIGTDRQKLHLQVVHGGDLDQLDCICEVSAWRFAKRRALGCSCRSRKRGSPKVGTGPCCRHDFRPRKLGRAAWRRDRHLWLGGLDADDRRAVAEDRS